MSFDWNKYGGDFMKFSDIGDSVAGEILAIEEGKNFKGAPCPQLIIDTDSGVKKVTAGQAFLQMALTEKRPEVGDFVTITFYDVGENKKGNPPKLFNVEVKAASGEPVTADDLAF